MSRKATESDPVAEAARLESAAQKLHDRVDATHKAAHDLRLRATAARQSAQQASQRARTQALAATSQTSRLHETEKSGDAAHQKIRKLKG